MPQAKRGLDKIRKPREAGNKNRKARAYANRLNAVLSGQCLLQPERKASGWRPAWARRASRLKPTGANLNLKQWQRATMTLY